MTTEITTSERLSSLIAANQHTQAIYDSRSGYDSLSQYQRDAAEVYNRAIQLREEINATDPEAWGYEVTYFETRTQQFETVKMNEYRPFSVPKQPLRWWTMAVRQATARNERRSFIKARYPESTGTERAKLFTEAHELGPFEPVKKGDTQATEYIKTLAASMKDDAESIAFQQGACIDCGNLAQPNELLCTTCGADPKDHREQPHDRDGSELTHQYETGGTFNFDGNAEYVQAREWAEANREDEAEHIAELDR